ncbi:helix-turn-helix transcriptional regulator [Chelatococcus sp. YT9]|uniref:helix-turn-helix domain-containing protein n=1 Tax=unclassified Chelatococcus TaxID=2638111 RepID=UPI001BD07A9D|nr:helix-turn-helix transcriptional regulator [Chelatococcus sp. YT9]MBX3556897.1 helix-turn-helix transcriptional regulator [Chelatococcus sp.]
MTPTQSRAARALLEWSQSDLAKHANLSESTVRDFEKGRRVPSPNNLSAMVAALRKNGVVLIEDGAEAGIGGEGARFFQPSPGAVLRTELYVNRSLLEFETERLNQFRNLLAQGGLSKESMEFTRREEQTVQARIETISENVVQLERRLAELGLPTGLPQPTESPDFDFGIDEP